jgi:hypothetical protein
LSSGDYRDISKVQVQGYAARWAGIILPMGGLNYDAMGANHDIQLKYYF